MAMGTIEGRQVSHPASVQRLTLILVSWGEYVKKLFPTLDSNVLLSL